MADGLHPIVLGFEGPVVPLGLHSRSPREFVDLGGSLEAQV